MMPSHIGPADARRNQVELEFSLFVDHRVPGIIAAGIADYAIHLPGKVINDLPLAFVAPLAPDNGVCRHS